MIVYHFDNENCVVTSDYDATNFKTFPVYGIWGELNGFFHECRDSLLKWRLVCEYKNLIWLQKNNRECNEFVVKQKTLIEHLELQRTEFVHFAAFI